MPLATQDGKLRILLLEDNRLDAQLVIERLKLAGVEFEFAHVATREEFLHRLKTDRFDVILADYTLPAWDGMQALELARNLNPGVPFIFVSGTMAEDMAVEAFRRGATDYIVKTRLQMLPNAIERALREAELAEQQRRANSEVNRAGEVMRETDKLATIGRLVATIVHEINNPLEAVSNLIYLIGTDPELSPNAQSYVAMARKEMDRVVQITKHTLNFYREASEPVEVAPTDLIEEVLVLFARKIENKGLTLEKNFEYAEKIRIMPGEMRQVFANLIGNAIDATESGGRLFIRTHRARQWSDEGVTGIRVLIADTGSGMDRDTLKKLGNPFFTRKGEKGTGLGLWVTKRIVSKYGGTLNVRSATTEHRHGTAFALFLPSTLHPVAVANKNSDKKVEQGNGAKFGLVPKSGRAMAD